MLCLENWILQEICIKGRRASRFPVGGSATAKWTGRLERRDHAASLPEGLCTAHFSSARSRSAPTSSPGNRRFGEAFGGLLRLIEDAQGYSLCHNLRVADAQQHLRIAIASIE